MNNKSSKIISSLIIISIFMLFFSTTINADTKTVSKNEKNQKLESVTGDIRKESYVNGIVYQLSAEVKGLQKQAYVLAKIKLDENLAEKNKYDKPLAIISDIDATLMDDVTYMTDIVLREGEWDNGPWDYYYDSVASTGCVAIPGAVEFCKYAQSKGVELFYITNRDWDKLDLTVEQLKRAGFPNADKDHVQVMNKEGSSNKTERRENVLKTHEVLLYIGDNIGDFTSDFAREMGAIKRTQMATDPKYKDLWGNKWIVLPNATYGDYVGAVWYNDKKADKDKKLSEIKALFDNYKFTNENFKDWYKEIK